jgi:hypothetical protein
VGDTVKVLGPALGTPVPAETDIDDEPTMPRGPRPTAKELADSAPPDKLRLRLPDRRRYALSRPLTIGRAPGNDVVIDDPCVSRYHCKIHIMADKAFVERLSTKPMKVNGIECPGGWLSEGSTLQIGRTEMWVVPAGSPSSLKPRR